MIDADTIRARVAGIEAERAEGKRAYAELEQRLANLGRRLDMLAGAQQELERLLEAFPSGYIEPPVATLDQYTLA